MTPARNENDLGVFFTISRAECRWITFSSAILFHLDKLQPAAIHEQHTIDNTPF